MKTNRARDRKNIASLERGGWKVLTIWQCELKNLDKLTSKLNDFFENN